MPHPLNVGDASAITEEHLKRIISLLAACHTHLVLDLSKSLRPTDICALGMSDFIFLVVQLEITSIRNTIRLLSTLDADAALAPKVKLVLNRVGMVTDITREKAVELLGRPFFWEVPNDHKVMMESRNSGTPMVKSAPVSKIQHNFSDFADEICSKTKPTKGPNHFGTRCSPANLDENTPCLDYSGDYQDSQVAWVDLPTSVRVNHLMNSSSSFMENLSINLIFPRLVNLQATHFEKKSA